MSTRPSWPGSPTCTTASDTATVATPLYGQRAADFVVSLRRERILVELGPSEFEHLCEAMRLHSDGHVEGEPAIRACWDADRLGLEASRMAEGRRTDKSQCGRQARGPSSDAVQEAGAPPRSLTP